MGKISDALHKLHEDKIKAKKDNDALNKENEEKRAAFNAEYGQKKREVILRKMTEIVAEFKKAHKARQLPAAEINILPPKYLIYDVAGYDFVIDANHSYRVLFMANSHTEKVTIEIDIPHKPSISSEHDLNEITDDLIEDKVHEGLEACQKK